MSSTYAHYQGPSSLPSDYAILSRLNTDHEPESQPEQINRRVSRRESFPASHYYRPLNPTIGIYPCLDSHSKASQHAPTETSPLLDHPPVPRIEENIHNASADNPSTATMFWEELAVLTKYAMPVFGYAPRFNFHEIYSD
jgi:multidrug resistance protein, MATE family